MVSYGAAQRRTTAWVLPARARAQLHAWQLIFFPLALLYLAAGWYLAMVRAVFDGDAISRTAQAGYVVGGRDPHLAAIGFVWNPLPSLVQVPFVAILRPFGLQVFAGAIQSGLFMAGTAALLWHFTALYDHSIVRRAIYVALFAANPLIVLYGANGMSEGMFIFFLTGMIYAFAHWATTERPLSLVGMALMTAGAFGVRYEALPLAAAGGIAVLIVLLAQRRRKAKQLEASLLIYATPVAYAVALWIFFNWTIMGDPFFFQHSIYSNEAQTTTFNLADNYLSGTIGSPLGALRYAAERLLAAFAAFGIVLAGATIAVLKRNWTVLGLAGMALVVPLFHTYLLYSGASWGWLRFYMYSVPGAFLLAPPLLAAIRPRWASRAVYVALVLAFAASNVLCLATMRDPDIGRQEHFFLGRIADPAYPVPNFRSYVEDRAVVAYVRQNLGGQRIMLDTVQGYAIWLYADHPEQFIISSDRDFADLLAAPRGQVDYLIAPSPVAAPADRINTLYPDLYAGGLPWATLVRDFGGETGWRLFRIAPPPTP